MASVRALALRSGEVEEKLAALADRVNARLASPLPAPQYSKMPEIARIERLEYLAGLLEASLGSEAPTDGESGHEVRQAPPRESEPAPAPVAPATPGPQSAARKGRR